MRRPFTALLAALVALAVLPAAPSSASGPDRIFAERRADGGVYTVGEWADGSFTTAINEYAERQGDGAVFLIWEWEDGSYSVAVRQYSERREDGSTWLVRQWDDGDYTEQRVLFASTASAPAANAAAAAPIPAATAERCFTVSDHRFGDRLPTSADFFVIEGEVVNRCDSRVAGTIRLASLRKSSQPNGPDLPGFNEFEIRLPAVAPRASQTFQIPVRPDAEAGTYTWTYSFRTSPAGSTGHGLPSWDVGGSSGVFADVRLGLGGAISDLLKVEQGRRLAQKAAESGTVFRVEHLPVGTAGTYTPRTKTVVLDDRLMAYGSRQQASVLAHELQHAADDAAGKLGTRLTCFANEEDAFRTEGAIWAALWGGTLPRPTTSLDSELNDIALKAAYDPYALIGTYLASYGHECGASPPSGATDGPAPTRLPAPTAVPSPTALPPPEPKSCIEFSSVTVVQEGTYYVTTKAVVEARNKCGRSIYVGYGVSVGGYDRSGRLVAEDTCYLGTLSSGGTGRCTANFYSAQVASARANVSSASYSSF